MYAIHICIYVCIYILKDSESQIRQQHVCMCLRGVSDSVCVCAREQHVYMSLGCPLHLITGYEFQYNIYVPQASRRVACVYVPCPLWHVCMCRAIFSSFDVWCGRTVSYTLFDCYCFILLLLVLLLRAGLAGGAVHRGVACVSVPRLSM